MQATIRSISTTLLAVAALIVLSDACAGYQPPRFSTPPAGPSSGAAAPTTRAFNGIQSWSQYVTMRDGVRLAVDVYLPKPLQVGERTATILHASRYYRSLDLRSLWKPFLGFGPYAWSERSARRPFVEAGYSWIDVDIRGTGASFGHRDYPLSPDEVLDGRDVVDWIVAQPWSAGVVGATGLSYDGMAASMLLRNDHPAVKAVAPRFSGWDLYEDIFRPGGLQAVGLLRGWAGLVTALDRNRLGDVIGWANNLVVRGVRQVNGTADSDLRQAFAEHEANVDLISLLGGVVYRDDTIPRGGPVTMDDFSPHTLDTGVTAGAAVYSYTGWFETANSRGQVRQFLSQPHDGSRLIIGPWFHAGFFNASPYANARNEDFDHTAELLRFFDYHLRGIDDDFTSTDPVRYYVMGEERWRSSPTWPPPGAARRDLFFGPEQGLSGQRAIEASAHDRYQVDLSATTGAGSRWGFVFGTGVDHDYPDRRSADRRLLTYTSPPLEAPLEVTGHPVVRLFLGVNATDGGVFVYLEDVGPDGTVTYVTEGQLRLIHRRLGTSPFPGDPVPFRTYRRADASPVVPGNVEEVVFDLLPTSFVFRAGHSIRVAIAGADAGNFAVPTMASPLVYDVHRDAEHPSHIELPIYVTAR